ncbi:hypothetical protein A8C56_22695 [Niabella ginsenosidivorans]|uniref:RNA polymerase sigma-70 factor n=1 Tax=Niabella ginsenosidivorans TaxID=1176587 RepID=A0A1A9IC53_9BACT|nr:hypothetical protein A8C56_22695 [Niabella ginsenosidivorans]
MLIAKDDQRAFRDLFNLFAERLTAFSYSITRNRDAASEVLDTVFIKLWKNRRSLADVQNLTIYLYAAVKNASLNYLARKANENQTQPFDFINIQLTHDELPDQKLISAEIFEKIKKAVDELPTRCKMIFKLVREDGLKYKEVARVLNISENTVDAQMVIAVKRIGASVRHYFDYFPGRFQKKQ